MRTGHHGSALTHLPGSHHVADGVDHDVEAEIAHPRDDEVATIAVGIGESQTARTATIDGSDQGQLVEARQQARSRHSDPSQ